MSSASDGRVISGNGATRAAIEPVRVSDLTLAYGDTVIQRDLSFEVKPGTAFVIMGGSGSGKSTLLRAMIGLLRPVEGAVYYGERSFWNLDADEQEELKRQLGVAFQGGALWSSMTLAENVGMPLDEYTTLDPRGIRSLASFKLSLVGLAGFEGYYPSEISGGMRKRAGLARALALDPAIVYFDEPSAGLDPISANRLDDLILVLKEVGMTLIVVTHELQSIFKIADDAILLDNEAKTMIARGNPRRLLAESEDPRVVEFLSRGQKEPDDVHREATPQS